MLKQIPTDKHLARAYFELEKLGALSTGKKDPWPYKPASLEELFCLCSDMSRYDPRLFSVLVSLLSEQWSTFDPQKIRSFYSKMKTPQTVAVIAEFLISSRLANNEALYFFQYLQSGLSHLPLQYFFMNLYSPGSHLAARAMDAPLKEYTRWGFMAREAPVIDMASRKPLGTLSKIARLNVLKHLIKENGQIKISDYLLELKNMISRQQALLDLKSCVGIEMIGQGRGSFWRLAA